MKPEKVVSLVKELEKIKSIRARNSYRGAWFGLIISVIGLIKLYMISLENTVVQGGEWLFGFSTLVALTVCLQSFYIIVRHVTNRKFDLIIEALLESKPEN